MTEKDAFDEYWATITFKGVPKIFLKQVQEESLLLNRQTWLAALAFASGLGETDAPES
jgi:hypothetical protein